MRSRHALAVFLLTALLADVAFGARARAEEVAPPAAAAAPVTEAAPPAAASAPDANETPAKRAEVAREIVKLFDLKTMLSSVMAMTARSIAPMIVEANPGQDEKIAALVAAAAQKAIAGHMDELEKHKADVYADTFSYDELKQLRDFYQSPVGQKMIKATPGMISRSASLDRDVMTDTMRDTNKEIVRQLKKNGMKVPKDMGV